jgi:hypothetical protein
MRQAGMARASTGIAVEKQLKIGTQTRATRASDDESNNQSALYDHST